MRSLRFFPVFLIVLFFLLVIAIAIPVAAAESSAYAQMDEFKTTMFHKKIGLSSCNADRHDEFRLSSTRNWSDYRYPQISGDIITWWEFDHTTVPSYFVQVVNLTAGTIMRFPGLYPSVDGHTVAFVTLETSQSSQTWSQIWIYDTLSGETRPLLMIPLQMKTLGMEYGLVHEMTAIGGDRVVWVSWTPVINAQGNQVSAKERIYSYNLNTDVITALTAESSVETLVFYGLKTVGDYAVWVNDRGGTNPRRTITLMDFKKNVQEDLGYLDPGLNQSFPYIKGKYLVWVAFKQDADAQKEVVLYDITAKKIIKRLQTFRPGPPVLSDDRVIWSETSSFRVYNISADYGQTFTPQHYPVNLQKDYRLKGYSGEIDASESGIVYHGESDNGGQVFLYDLEITPCFSIPSPVIKANPEDGYAPLTVTFDGSASSSKKGSIQQYHWTLPLLSGKVTTMYGQKVTHTFTQPGSYRVDLMVKDTNGKEAMASQYIVVLNPDEVRITRDPLWDQAFPQIYGDNLCWLETYQGNFTSDLQKLDPELTYGPMRIAAYNLKSGERKILGPTDNMYCDVSDALIAYIGKDMESSTEKYWLRIFSLPGMSTVGTWETGGGRKAQVSGYNVVWEEFVSKPPAKLPGDNTATLGEQMAWQGDVQLLKLPSAQFTQVKYINVTQDTIDSNWPQIDGDFVIWVDYSDPRTWPDKKPVLRVLNINTGQKFSIPTDAVQIQPEIDENRVIWINDWAKSRDTFDGWNSTLYLYNLSTGQKTLLKTLGSSNSRLAVFGDRVFWEDQGQIHMLNLVTNQDVVLKFPYAVDHGFDPYCDLIAFADHRTGDYDIYLKVLQGSETPGQAACNAHKVMDLYTAAQTKAQEGGSILLWNPIDWIIQIVTSFFVPPAVSTPSQSQMETSPTSPPYGNSCDDQNFCTVNDQFIQGICTGSPISCNDGNSETMDSCDPTSGCVFTPIRTVCDDQNRCTANDHWGNGICQGDPFACDDGNPETQDTCDPKSGCIFTPILTTSAGYTPCDDGNACTVNDSIIQGVCTGSPLNCDDKNPETQDSCNPESGCMFMPVAPAGVVLIPCDDGNACTENDRIIRDVCTGSPLVCDDGNPRTQDICDPVSGCIYSRVPITTPTPAMVCPEGCTCMTPSEALQIYGHAIRCSDTPCAADYSSITRVLYKYCYRPAG